MGRSLNTESPNYPYVKFRDFTFFFHFGIEAYFQVALAERSSNLPSNSKKVNVVTGNSIFRSRRRFAEASHARRHPPVRGPFAANKAENAPANAEQRVGVRPRHKHSVGVYNERRRIVWAEWHGERREGGENKG